MHGEKKTVLYRYGAVVTALLMLLAVFVLPVMREEQVKVPMILILISVGITQAIAFGLCPVKTFL